MVNGLSLILYKGSKSFLTTSPIHPITHAFMLLFLSVPTLWLADWRNQRSTHHTGTWNHVSIIYGIASTTFSSAHSALFSVSCFFSTFLLYPSLFSSYQLLSVSQQSPGLELFLNMSEWIEGQWVCKRTHRHTHTAQHNDALAFQECLWANWKQPCVRDEWMKRGQIPYESIRSW